MWLSRESGERAGPKSQRVRFDTGGSHHRRVGRSGFVRVSRSLEAHSPPARAVGGSNPSTRTKKTSVRARGDGWPSLRTKCTQVRILPGAPGFVQRLATRVVARCLLFDSSPTLIAGMAERRCTRLLSADHAGSTPAAGASDPDELLKQGGPSAAPGISPAGSHPVAQQRRVTHRTNGRESPARRRPDRRRRRSSRNTSSCVAGSVR